MMKKCLIASLCWFVIACYGVTSHATVMLNVSLTNFAQSSTEVTFDIEAAFSSLDINGDPQLGDFVSSLLFGLENSSAGLLSVGPNPYDRFTAETAGFPWDGGVDAVNGRISLDARTNLDYLVHDTPLTLARLHISTEGLANDDYVLSLNSSNNFGQGTLDGVDNDVLLASSIITLEGKFTVFNNTVVPEPGSMSILGLGAVSIFCVYRRRFQR
jgi:PEP-CTERM motif